MKSTELESLIASVSTPKRATGQEVQAHLDSLTKPQGSLGALETMALRLAKILGDPPAKLARRTVCIMAGDHGVAEEGVSAFPSEVTAQMCLNYERSGAAINALAGIAGAQVVVVDVGVDGDLGDARGVVSRKVRRGTRNFVKEPAMTSNEVLEAIAVGVDMIADLRPDVIGLGEMGIGNTTSAAAITAMVTGKPVEFVTGPGTGVDGAGVSRKVQAVNAGLSRLGKWPAPLDVLAEVGGLEIAGMVGLILGGAKRGIPVIVDGYITGAAALLACEMCPAAKEYLFASHVSQEPGHAIQLEHLGLQAALHLEMRLGEGTGAALMFAILESAGAILRDMATFAEADVSGKTD